MTDPIRDLLISLSSHMAYMQGQLEARGRLGETEDYCWYRESVLLRQKVMDALADEPAVPQPPTEDRAGRLAVAAALRALNTQLGHNVLGVRSVDCSQIELIAQELEASL